MKVTGWKRVCDRVDQPLGKRPVVQVLRPFVGELAPHLRGGLYGWMNRRSLMGYQHWFFISALPLVRCMTLVKV